VEDQKAYAGVEAFGGAVFVVINGFHEESAHNELG
jgi:hypothetical protein